MGDRRGAAGAVVLALLVGSLAVTGESVTARVLAAAAAVLLLVAAAILGRRPAPAPRGVGPDADPATGSGLDESLAVYGIRVDLRARDLDAARRGDHPLCVAATAAGLEHHVAGGAALYLGRRLARLGVEHDLHVVLDAAALRAVRDDVDGALAGLGRPERARLHLALLSGR